MKSLQTKPLVACRNCCCVLEAPISVLNSKLSCYVMSGHYRIILLYHYVIFERCCPDYRVIIEEYPKAPFTLLLFCTKTETKTSVFVKVFTLIRTKTPQKRRFLKTLQINVNAQKRRFLKTLQYPIMSFTNPEQCERTKTDIFGSVFVIRQINVNAQKRRFFSLFLYKNGAV